MSMDNLKDSKKMRPFVKEAHLFREFLAHVCGRVRTGLKWFYYWENKHNTIENRKIKRQMFISLDEERDIGIEQIFLFSKNYDFQQFPFFIVRSSTLFPPPYNKFFS